MSFAPAFVFVFWAPMPWWWMPPPPMAQQQQQEQPFWPSKCPTGGSKMTEAAWRASMRDIGIDTTDLVPSPRDLCAWGF